MAKGKSPKDLLEQLNSSMDKTISKTNKLRGATKKVTSASNKRNKSTKTAITLDGNLAKHLKFISSLYTAHQKQLIKAGKSQKDLVIQGVALNAQRAKEEAILTRHIQKKKLLNAIDKKDLQNKKELRQRVAKNIAAQERLVQVEKKRKKSLNDFVTQQKLAGKSLKGQTQLIHLYRKALKRGGVAEKKFRFEMKKLKVQTDATRISFLKFIMAQHGLSKAGVLGVRNTRNSSSAFSVLRSKLLLASFAAMLVQNSIMSLVRAFGEQEKAERKVHQAMFTTGLRASVTSNEIVRYAAELQKLTGVGD